tara:strand:+ start:56 stop:1621 length:1566 start_codon:yes stop_codon:yes gene_type:complete
MFNYIKFLLFLCFVGFSAFAKDNASQLIAPSSLGDTSTDHGAMQWVLRGIKHNLGLKIGRMEVTNYNDRVIISLANFAPRFSTTARYRESELAQNRQQYLATSEIAPIFEDEVASMELRLEGRMYYGTQVSLYTTTSRLENTTNQNINTNTLTGPRFFPEYQTSTQLQVIQPLLKNRGTKVNLAASELARSEVLGAHYALRSELEKTIAQILVSYAEAEFGVANLQVKQDAVRLADDLIDENRRRVEEGIMTSIDVTQAQARRAEAMEAVVEARTFLSERENSLIELTGTEYNFGMDIQISESIDDLLPLPQKDRIDIGRSMLASNPIYLAALERVEAEGIRVAYAKNQLMPQLDIEATLGINGLQDSFRGSYRDFSNRDHPDWSVGLVLSMPLDRSSDRAQVSLAKRIQSQALFTAKQTEVQLLILLDNSMHEVEAARERITLANDSVRHAEDVLRSEQRKLSSGLTTSYNVLNQQRDLSFARTRALAAEVELFRAVTQLYVAEGSLSKQLNLEVTVASK